VIANTYRMLSVGERDPDRNGLFGLVS
jgi:hypothetical protein